MSAIRTTFFLSACFCLIAMITYSGTSHAQDTFVRLNQSNCLKVKGAHPRLEELAAQHFSASIDQIKFLRTEFNEGMCFVVWSHPKGICRASAFVGFASQKYGIFATNVVDFDAQKDTVMPQRSMRCR